MRAAKPRLPEGLDAIADEAGERLLSRQAPPRVQLNRSKDGWSFSCPYAPEDEQRWEALLADTFGTRSGGLINHFLDSITRMVPEGQWNDRKRYWYPDEAAFNAVLAIVSSLRPENEAQAAHAAQLAALHLAAMKLGGHAASSGDARTVAVLAKTSRAYGEGVERMARLQGKLQAKTVNQTIQVIYADNRSINQFAGGVSPNGGQPHGATGGEAAQCAALPSPRQVVGETVSLPCGEGQAGVPRSRWGARIRRTLGLG